MSTTTTRPVTAAEFFSWPNDNLRNELIRGEVRTMCPAGGEHGEIAGEVFGLLRDHVKRQKLGKVYAAETGFVIGREPDTVLAPDASFVRLDRLSAIENRKMFLPFAPDLTVEVISPDDRPDAIAEKTAEWLAAGTRMVWNVFPQSRTVAVHTPDAPAHMLAVADTLDGGAVVLGFACRVGDLFAE